MTLVRLCSGKNNEGYWHALFASFDIGAVPVKSSLSKIRQKISYVFFADHFRALLKSFKRPTWKGLHLYATDGFEVCLPRTANVLNEGYRGRRMHSKGKTGESYYPHLYMVHTYDVLSRTTKELCFGPRNNEIQGALENIKSLEGRSLTLYDRYYCAGKLMRAHFEGQSYFMIRCKRERFGVPQQVTEFFKSTLKRDSFLLDQDPFKRIYLYKIKHPKQKDLVVLATNKANLSVDDVRSLYRLRWEAENSFRDIVETLKVEQWHSKSINGIYQEIYVRMWIMNFARIHQYKLERRAKNPISRIYQRSNFKLVLDFIITHWSEFFYKPRKVLQILRDIILKTTEKRKRYSRSYPRQIRFNPSHYKAANIIFDLTQKREKI